MNEEERFDFEQKHEEDLQRLRGFRLLDDDFMSKVFEDKDCVEFLLQIILERVWKIKVIQNTRVITACWYWKYQK